MMPTRNLGKTGFRAGIFGLGGQGALEKTNNDAVALPLIERALELGVNYYDTSAIYGGPTAGANSIWDGRLRDIAMRSLSRVRRRNGRAMLHYVISRSR